MKSFLGRYMLKQPVIYRVAIISRKGSQYRVCIISQIRSAHKMSLGLCLHDICHWKEKVGLVKIFG